MMVKGGKVNVKAYTHTYSTYLLRADDDAINASNVA